MAFTVCRRGWKVAGGCTTARSAAAAAGSAFLEVQSILEPGKRYVLEEKRKEDVDDEESGDPPAGGMHRS
jgi:hypothetical protein